MKIIKRNYNKDFRKGMVYFHSDAATLADYDLYGYSLLNATITKAEYERRVDKYLIRMQTLFDNTINAVLRYAHIGMKIELDFTDFRQELLERYDKFMKIDVEDDGFDRVE